MTQKTEKVALADGDVVKFDYTLYVDGKMLETSDESIAKAKGIHREGRRYQPLVISLGTKSIISGLESHIRSHGIVGTQVKVDIAAVDAYGERHADKIKDVPMAQFKAQKTQPQPGMQVTLGGERGIVTRVAGGRVRVDLNHDLAGKALTYEYTLREVLRDEKARVDAVLGNMFKPGSYKVEITDKALIFEAPDAAKFDQNWMMAKFRVVAELRMATNKKKAIHVVEVFPVMDADPGHEYHDHGPGEKH